MIVYQKYEDRGKRQQSSEPAAAFRPADKLRHKFFLGLFRHAMSAVREIQEQVGKAGHHGKCRIQLDRGGIIGFWFPVSGRVFLLSSHVCGIAICPCSAFPAGVAAVRAACNAAVFAAVCTAVAAAVTGIAVAVSDTAAIVTTVIIAIAAVIVAAAATSTVIAACVTTATTVAALRRIFIDNGVS